MIELENLLRNVPGSYDDFVKWVIMVVKKTDSLEEIKKYIQNNPTETDEQIGEWIDKHFPTPNNNDEIPEWVQEDEED